MNREQTKKCIKFMQAFVDGEIVAADNVINPSPKWNWCNDTGSYEVKEFEPDPGDNVSVRNFPDELWERRVFAARYSGDYYCEEWNDSKTLIRWVFCKRDRVCGKC